MGDDLEERIRSSARAFEGLMSLIPAERYYEKDNSEQYKKKKQTPEERKAARKAKLNPENHKSAKDVMDENERKRKRELEADNQESDDIAVDEEKPRQGMKHPSQKRARVDKAAQNAQQTSQSEIGATEPTSRDKSDEQKAAEKAQRKKEKEDQKKEKIARKEEKRAAKKAAKKAVKVAQDDQAGEASDYDEAGQDISMSMTADDLDAVDVSGLADERSTSPSPERESVFSNNSAQPSASSTSSIETAITDATPNEEFDGAKKKIAIPPVDKLALQARLQAKIEALRAARKADGPDGRPARNRAELIEARRKKAEQKKQAKKDQRAKAKDDEARERTEAELARLRGSGSPLGSDIFSPSIPRSPDTNFNFGRVAFQDGQQLDSNLSYFTQAPNKGPSDTKTALAMAQKKQARLNGLDEAKRADISEKDMWLNAKKKVHGERVKDDVSLLKKTLKRSDKEKKKSEKEWTTRIDGVAKGIEMRQKKREDNLQKRRDERGGGKKKPAPSKKRPGFEGGFRNKPGK